jgi:hypothetical protein
MTIHSPECERYLSELLSAPMDSVDHDIAAYIATLDDEHARAFVLTVMDEDPLGSRPFEIARTLWQLLTAVQR